MTGNRIQNECTVHEFPYQRSIWIGRTKLYYCEADKDFECIYKASQLTFKREKTTKPICMQKRLKKYQL